MATHQYPVLIWADSSGANTAVLIGDFESAAAYASDADEALQQIKDLLEWRLENEPWNADPDLLEPEFVEVKVEVRPQYIKGKRVVPCPDTVWLRVPCVLGNQENGLRLCAVPHLGLTFNFQDPAGLKSLVAHYVKESLQGLSPLDLAGRLPPRNCRLEKVVLRGSADRVRRLAPEGRPELKVLFAVADPLLHDLGRKRASSAAYGRDPISTAVARKLGEEKANVLLVGDAGIGKTTVLLDAARKLARDKSTSPTSEELEEKSGELRSYRFWRSSGGRMIAGMRYLGEWQERCEEFIKQLTAIGGVFCAENLLDLVRVGGEGPNDSVAAFLLPYLQRGELRMAAEATPTEVNACQRLFPGLLDVFQIVTVPHFSDPQAIEVLGKVAHAYAATSKLEIAPPVVPLVHRLFKRFLPYAALPGPAANFLRILCDPRSSRTKPSRSVTNLDVVELFTRRTGLPEIFLRDDLPLNATTLRQRFDARVIGQPHATTAASRVVLSIKAGLSDPARPFGVLLFCGPTGVGKTALAKEMTDFCFGSGAQKDRLVRLDMSEYAGWGSAQRLLEDGRGNPAPWIERVRRQPFCLLLLDEIEKAAPEVFDVLLGLLDEGRLTDRFGRVTNFRSAIIVLTSNLGSTAQGQAGFNPALVAPAFESEVMKFFRPEFFNRLDAVITFTALTMTDVAAIVRKELTDLQGREGFAAANIQLLWSDRLVATVARHGYDHRFGARPLQRCLERLVVKPLAYWKVSHAQVRGTVLRIDIADDESLTIEPAK